MRRTVVLDPDVEKLVRSLMRERGVSLSQAVNDAIRAAFTPSRQTRTRRFTQKTFRLGSAQYFRWDKALAAADAIDDEELSRKLSL